MPVRVLVIDDSEGIRSMLKMRLEYEGYVVVGEAADGSEGVELAELLRPDVVIMDLEMPGIPGDEATVRLLGRVPSTNVVAYTSSARNAARRMIDAGARASFDKHDFKGLLEYIASLSGD